MNELIFFAYVALILGAMLGALFMGQQALFGLFCTFGILINLFSLKRIELLGHVATASDALAVGMTLSLNLLQEFFGKPSVFRAIWSGFFCSALYVCFSILHLRYTPALDDVSQSHFAFLLEPMPRIIAASLFVFLVVQYADAFLYGKLRTLSHRFYVLRNLLSVGLTQLLDTTVFTFLAFYGLSEAFDQSLLEIITVSYSVKLATALLAIPFLAFAKRIAKIQIQSK